jgi:hypothetical protein
MNYLRLLLLTIILFSCKKVEFDKISSNFYSPKLALPIAYGDFKISDILKQADSIDKYIDPNSRPLLQLKINQDVKGFSIADAVKLPDFNTLPEQSIYSFDKLKTTDLALINNIAKSSNPNTRINFLDILKIYDQNLQLSQSIDLNFSSGSDLPSDFKLNNIKFSKGKIKVKVKQGLPHTTILKFTFNEITKSSKKLSDSLVYIPGSDFMEINLVGYEADFSLNKLTFSIDELVIIPVNKDILSTDKIILGVEMADLGFESIEGYFGQLKLDPIIDTLKIEELKDLKGAFGITNPSINLSVLNGFGIPVDLGFEKFSVIKKDNTKIPLTVNTPLKIESPSSLTSPAVKSNIILNSTTVSNFDKLLSSETKEIQIGGNVTVNKGSTSSTKNFIKNTSTISLNAEINVPLTGYATGFKFSDTSDFSLPADVLKSLQINLQYRNTLPIDVDADVYFLDAFDKPILVGKDTLNLFSSTSDKLIKSPLLTYDQVSNSYILKESDINSVPYQSLIISLKETDLPYLKKAVKVVFKGSFDTLQHPDKIAAKENTPITLYDYYGLSIKLFANAKGSVPFKK